MTNLQSRSHILLEHLISAGYSNSSIKAVKRCISLSLEFGPNDENHSYDEIFENVITHKYKHFFSPRYSSLLKTQFSVLKKFDLEGKLPKKGGERGGAPLERSGKIDDLMPCFKDLALKHLENGYKGTNRIKREKTVRTEFYGAVKFLFHLQERGIKSLKDVKSMDLFSFFYDGDKEIRGKDYCALIKHFLSHIEGEYGVEAQRIIDLLPRISKNRRLYEGLSKEEGDKILLALEDFDNGLSLRDRAIGFLLYFYGLRGTDLSKLTFDDIDWYNNQIVIIQSKTSKPLPLPLEPIVGNTIFNYLKEVRMNQTDTTKVLFLKNDGTEPPVTLVNSVYNVFKAAGVRQEEGAKGFRPMRHFFVTSLLAAGEKCEVIAKLMGHSDISTLDRYADTNYLELKKCSLSISSFPINPEIFKI